MFRTVILFSLLVANAIAQPPAKFDRVVVFSCGSLRTAVYLGAIEQAIEQGAKPDVVLTTCGSSLAGAIINTSDDPKQWREYIESPEFYDYVKSVTVNDRFARVSTALPAIGGMFISDALNDISRRPIADKIPNVFSDYLVNLPMNSALSIDNQPFRKKEIRSVMVAAKLSYDASQAGEFRNGRKLYQEVFFTDPDTALHLEGLVSPVARNFPQSPIHKQTAVITDAPLYTGARASMSEPFLVPLFNRPKPGRRGEKEHFLAGSIDSYPIEVAHHLGKEVIGTAVGHIGEENIVFDKLYGFSVNDMRKTAMSQPADFWFDSTNDRKMEMELDYGPNKDFRWSDVVLYQKVPDTHDAFVEKLRAQWEYGKQMMKAALSSPRGSRENIVHPGDGGNFDIVKTSESVTPWMRGPLAPLATVKGAHERIKAYRQESKATEDEEEDDEHTPETSAAQWAVGAGGDFLAFGLVFALSKLFRDHWTHTTPKKFREAVAARTGENHGKSLYIEMGDGPLPEESANRHAIRVKSSSDLFDQLRTAEELGPYHEIHLSSAQKKQALWGNGQLRFGDGTVLTPAEISHLGSLDLHLTDSGASLIVEGSVGRAGIFGSRKAYVDQLGSALLSEGGHLFIAGRNIVPPPGDVAEIPGRALHTALSVGTGARFLRQASQVLRPRRLYENKDLVLERSVPKRCFETFKRLKAG